jgi:hypothetical protein
VGVEAMDSEDDMHDANDSADDDFYSGGEAGLAASDDEDADYDFADHDSDDSGELLSHRMQVISGSLFLGGLRGARGNGSASKMEELEGC